LPLLIFLLAPLLALIARTSLAQILANLQQPAVYEAISLSLRTSIAAMTVTVLIGTPAAYLVARRQFRLKRAVDTLLDLPTVLPPAVAGVALLMAFGRRGLLGGLLAPLGIQLTFTPIAVVMAQTFVAAPLYLRAAILGFAAVDNELEQSAALDGAGEWQIFRHIILPLSANALLSGAVMMWARALGEFGATIIFAGNLPGITQTMPLAIYIGFELDISAALTLSVILMTLSFLVLIAVRTLLLRNRL
jgi:molybdate transport system permease protein